MKKLSEKLLWNKIKESCGRNFKVFDFGGTRRGSTLEIFKRGWGVKRYPIFELKNLKESKLRDSKLRNISNFLPSFLIKKLSPYLLKYKL